MWPRRDGGTLGRRSGGASSHHHRCRCRRRVCPASRSFKASICPGHRRLPRAASKASRTEWLVLRADYAVCNLYAEHSCFPCFPWSSSSIFRNRPKADRARRANTPTGGDLFWDPSPSSIGIAGWYRNGSGASRGEVGSHPSQRRQRRLDSCHHHHYKKRREKIGKSLSTCTPASEPLQSGGSVESGALQLFAGWLTGCTNCCFVGFSAFPFGGQEPCPFRSCRWHGPFRPLLTIRPGDPREMAPSLAIYYIPFQWHCEWRPSLPKGD